MSICDLCGAPAIADVQINGPWGYVCEEHLKVGAMGTLLNGAKRPCCLCQKPVKTIRLGKVCCAGSHLSAELRDALNDIIAARINEQAEAYCEAWLMGKVDQAAAAMGVSLAAAYKTQALYVINNLDNYPVPEVLRRASV